MVLRNLDRLLACRQMGVVASTVALLPRPGATFKFRLGLFRGLFQQVGPFVGGTSLRLPPEESSLKLANLPIRLGQLLLKRFISLQRITVPAFPIPGFATKFGCLPAQPLDLAPQGRQLRRQFAHPRRANRCFHQRGIHDVPRNTRNRQSPLRQFPRTPLARVRRMLTHCRR